ncbi:DUF2478 domain-containing protein [Aquabacter sp. CN5-332]|uniref:DUF2478 domain-containing protein n=1 Tax=Aquabacter sp. CN5-332 TaxID=3156608 RepID=UPI0032B575F5
MSTRSTAFDSDCDIAALVYTPDQHPDELMAAFAADLRARGVNAVGVLQGRNAHLPDAAGSGLVFIPGGRTLAIACCGSTEHPTSASWSSALIHAEAWLLKAARRRPDLLLLNRFGAAERSGGGLLTVISEAVARDVPVLLPVPQSRFTDWLRFTEGLSVKLDCTRASLDAWWNSVSRPLQQQPYPATFCEHSK